jgi:toxin ParE1/3/4
MAAFSIEFAPEAVEQLVQLEEYIAGQGSPRVATAYVDAILGFCESLQSFPNRGTQRDDIRPGLRITNYKGGTIIAFAVMGEVVYVIGVFYGGQDYETVLSVTAGH